MPDLQFWRQAYARELREIISLMEKVASDLERGPSYRDLFDRLFILEMKVGELKISVEQDLRGKTR
jgi:hypothetical protein